VRWIVSVLSDGSHLIAQVNPGEMVGLLVRFLGGIKKHRLNLGGPADAAD
jgi:hypothetical protein